jgi:hypothetical protein
MPETQKKFPMYIVWLVLLIIIVLGGWKLFGQPLPGQEVPDLGRDHVPLDTPFDYNSNPPTSGPHYEDWIRPGIFDSPQHDQKLIHSLEHGYVIISYNCDAPKIGQLPEKTRFSLIPVAMAHVEPEDTATDSGETATDSAHLDLPEWESDPDCQKLTGDLKGVYQRLGLKRMILVPRPNLDARIALTAWGRIDKFNDFDEERIANFAKRFHNRGPEQTME